MSENLDQLLDFLKTSLLVNPNDSYKRFQLGSTYLKLGKPEEAIKAFSRATSIKPEYFDAHLQLGLTYAGIEDWVHACESYAKAAELKPDHYDAHLQLAEIALRLERTDQAAKAY